MEDGNLKLYVLKIILKRKVFDRVKKIVSDSFFTNGGNDIYKAICKIYEDNPGIESISIDDLRISYFETYFANQSFQAQKNIKNLISRIQQIQDMNDGVVENAIKSMYKSSKADEMSKLCIAIGNNPSQHSFKEIQRFLETIDEEYFDTVDDTSVTRDVDEIIEAVNQQREYKFNIHALQNATEGIGKGNFMIVFARPESGKTAFWVSMVANEGGFAWQKKNVHIFCNEEPAIRTQMRMLNACSNLTKRQILNGSRQLAKDKWKEIESYIYTHDSVDMNMEDLNTYCKEHDVDILIIDQLDKVNVTGKYNSSHEKLGEVYRQAREIAKRHDVFVIGLSQASAEAHGRTRLSFNVMANSKTGKAAEADVIVGIGKLDEGREDPNEACVRQITISKNKLTGDHGEFEVRLVPTLSQFTSFT